MRDRLIAALVLFVAVGTGFILGVCLMFWTLPVSGAPHPVCTVTHSQVVMIPTLCDKAQLCDVPIVAKVCDQIEIENPEVKP